MVEHKNVIRLVINSNYVELGKETRILQTGAPTFDAAVFEIWGVLLNGGRLYLVPQAVIPDARQLEHQLKKNRVTTLWLSSALFNQLLQQNNDLFSGLEWLLVGGDVLSPLHINLVRKQDRKLKVVNGYGPTENTTFSTAYRIEKEFEDKIPIGKPIGNSTAYILDQYNHLQPPGVPGELYVGGDGVSRGYLNNPEMTTQKFLPVSYRSYISERIYKTGDLARWLPDGNIEFLGRIDQQIKIRGFRIELAEIECQLLKHDSIKEAAVIVVHRTHSNTRTSSANENKYINAYIVSDQELSTTDIREFLSKNLPVYMIPSHFIKIENLPLTLNGKVDKKKLMNLKQEVEPPIPPRCVVEEKLIEIWSDLLNIQKEKISINDNFFFIGGDSMKTTMMSLKLQKVFHASIPLTEIFNYPSIRELGAYIMRPQNKVLLAPNDNVVTLRKGNNPSNHLFLIHPADGGIEAYVELCNHLSNFNCWGIREDFDKPAHPDNLTINGTAKKYTEIIKQIQPHGPYYIAGWSLGGTFAYEIARHLEKQAEKVNFLGMIEGTPPGKKILIDYIIKRSIKREDHERNFTFNQAYDKYRPKGKINTIIHYLGTDMKRKDRWKGFSSKGIIYYKFPGDHFTLVRLPTVVKVAGLINKIINAAG
jgi:thioesterase domain-containing protein/acyl carrier protein